ncbi:AlbA family DNA-binding domain-containing protein [Bradyrhizobium frederickii]|nr:ATP-binding protein [Bradyrhizobium frederickii]
MESRVDQIRALGASYFEQIIADREEETLHLEFKTLAQDGGRLTRDDRKMIAEAIAGLANAEGGVLIIGIETKRLEGVDVAIGKRSVKQLQRTANLIRAQIPEMFSPRHSGIKLLSVIEAQKDDEGFVVIDVPASPDRPHYSNVHHQYFRRGADRTRVMEHGEIRDLMFATRHGSLKVRTSTQISMRSGNKFGGSFLLSVANAGQLPVRAPYLKVSPSSGWQAVGVGLLDVRQLRGNTVGLYAKNDQLVHVDDEFHLARRTSGIELMMTGDRSEIISKICETRDDKLFRIKPFEEKNLSDISFGTFRVTFGAENVLPDTGTFELGKWEMFEILAESLENASF